MEGKVFITASLCLNVTKTLDEQILNKKLKVTTIVYSYNLNTEGKRNSEIFRYDNFDLKPRKGHVSIHHIHRFDPPGREVLNSPFELDHDDVPTLGEVIEESFRYAVANIYYRPAMRKPEPIIEIV